MALTKTERRLRIKMRIRKKIHGTPEKPRLSVFRSNKNIFAQVIDDLSGNTLVSASSINKEVSGQAQGKDKKAQAQFVGKLLAEKAIEKGIKEVKFDRNGYLYHGRVKTLADAARKGGLKL
jgi:large subunit ribosomal protein L18